MASTLLAKAHGWLEAHNEVCENARSVVKGVLDKIPDNGDCLLDRSMTTHRALAFLAHAVMVDFIRSPSDTKAERAVLRVLTSGSESALVTLMSQAFFDRAHLGGRWWRLLKIAILWCALAVLVPGPNDSDVRHRQWVRWLAWLRRRSLVATATLKRINPTAIACRVARLQRRRWVRAYAQGSDEFGQDPHHRQSVGLDIRFLRSSFAWLLDESFFTQQEFDQADTEQCAVLLTQLLEFELWHYLEGHDPREISTQLRYDIIPAIVEVISRLPLEAASGLWQPLFGLGDRAGDLLGLFIDCWFQLLTKACDLEIFSQHWAALIQFALNVEWSSGYRRESMLCKLLGCGSEGVLDHVPALQKKVYDMKDIYQLWANTHLEKSGNVDYFCGFLASSTGRLLRIDGLHWIYTTMQIKQDEKPLWQLPNTVVDFLAMVLKDNMSGLTKDAKARAKFLEIVDVLVKNDCNEALVLQERAKASFSGKRFDA